jgi:hypothetical protein
MRGRALKIIRIKDDFQYGLPENWTLKISKTPYAAIPAQAKKTMYIATILILRVMNKKIRPGTSAGFFDALTGTDPLRWPGSRSFRCSKLYINSKYLPVLQYRQA